MIGMPLTSVLNFPQERLPYGKTFGRKAAQGLQLERATHRSVGEATMAHRNDFGVDIEGSKSSPASQHGSTIFNNDLFDLTTC